MSPLPTDDEAWSRVRQAFETLDFRDLFDAAIDSRPFPPMRIYRSKTVDDLLQNLRRRALAGDSRALAELESAARRFTPETDEPLRLAEAARLAAELVTVAWEIGEGVGQRATLSSPGQAPHPGWVVRFLGELVDWFPGRGASGLDQREWEVSAEGEALARRLRAATVRLLARLERPEAVRAFLSRSERDRAFPGPAPAPTQPAAPGPPSRPLAAGDRVRTLVHPIGLGTVERIISRSPEGRPSLVSIHLDARPRARRARGAGPISATEYQGPYAFHPVSVRRLRPSGEEGVVRVCADCEHEVLEDSTCACPESTFAESVGRMVASGELRQQENDSPDGDFCPRCDIHHEGPCEDGNLHDPRVAPRKLP